MVKSHIAIRNPDEGEESDNISAPIGIGQMEFHKNHKQDRDIMTEAIFAAEQEEKLSDE